MGSGKVSVVDLFCGAGGLSYGLKMSGMGVSAGIDIDPCCRHPFEANVGSRFLKMDVSSMDPGFLSSLYPGNSVRVLAGCAPCQPFSSYTQGMDRDRWGALARYADLVRAVRPDVIAMENVPGLARRPVFQKYLRTLKACGYHADYRVVNCADYGVPQNRRRLVLLASRYPGIRVAGPAPGPRPTVRSAIGHLDTLEAGSSSRDDPLHRASRLMAVNMRRMRSSRQGGTWRDWDRRLRAGCHTRGSGTRYSGVYGRMSWDEPSPTITTQFYGFGSGRFGHPSQDRALSLREGAILQSFPDGYSFVQPGSPISIKPVGRLIGNAVPVGLGRAMGMSIMGHLEDAGVVLR